MRTADSFFSSKKFIRIHRVGWIGAVGLFAAGFSTSWPGWRVAHGFTNEMEISGLIVTGIMMMVDIVWTLSKE